jgi:purine-binding chemotaxis protein CheW
MQQDQQYCTFELGDLYLGIEVQRVQEVLRAQEMTRVPLASRVVEGLINLRGQIVTAIDLRRRLGLPEREGGRPTNVVIRTQDGAISLLVDEIGDVVEVNQARCEDTPPTVPAEMQALVRGVVKFDDRLMLILDAERAIAVGD